MKGKAAKATAKGKDAAGDLPRYLVSVKDLISLAEWIVAVTKSPIDVPVGIVSKIDRAIAVQKRHHRWWHNDVKAPSQDKAEEEAGLRHA